MFDLVFAHFILVLLWPRAVDRTLKSNYWLTNQRFMHLCFLHTGRPLRPPAKPVFRATDADVRERPPSPTGQVHHGTDQPGGPGMLSLCWSVCLVSVSGCWAVCLTAVWSVFLCPAKFCLLSPSSPISVPPPLHPHNLHPEGIKLDFKIPWWMLLRQK